MSAQPALAAVPNKLCAPDAVAPQIVVPNLTIAAAVLELIRLQQNTRDPADLEKFLKRLVADTHLLLSASGSAIGLHDGQIYRWRARCGEPAPGIGAHIYSGSGISGQCLLSGEVQSCQDAWTDARVDAELCQRLGLRSIVVAPIKSARRIDGILEAWSGQPSAFDSRSLDILQELADLTSFAREKTVRLSMSLVVDLPSASSNEPSPLVTVVRVRKLMPSAQTALRRLKKFVELVAGKLGRPTAGTAPLSIPVRARGLVFAGFLTIAPLAAWYCWSGGARTVHAPTAFVPSQMPSLPAMSVADIQGDPLFHPQSSTPALRVAHHTQEETSGSPSLIEPTRPKALMVVPAKHQSAPTVIDDVPPPIVAPAAAATSVLSKSTVQLGDLLFSSTPATPAYPMSSGVTGGTLRTGAPPVYPGIAKAAGIEGTVVLQAVIDEQGHVQDLKVKEGPLALTQAAVEAVRQWQFEPYILDDHPVKMGKEIQVRFKLQ